MGHLNLTEAKPYAEWLAENVKLLKTANAHLHQLPCTNRATMLRTQNTLCSSKAAH